jgi:hypothetical protein
VLLSLLISRVKKPESQNALAMQCACVADAGHHAESDKSWQLNTVAQCLDVLGNATGCGVWLTHEKDRKLNGNEGIF